MLERFEKQIIEPQKEYAINTSELECSIKLNNQDILSQKYRIQTLMAKAFIWLKHYAYAKIKNRKILAKDDEYKQQYILNESIKITLNLPKLLDIKV